MVDDKFTIVIEWIMFGCVEKEEKIVNGFHVIFTLNKRLGIFDYIL